MIVGIFRARDRNGLGNKTLRAAQVWVTGVLGVGLAQEAYGESIGELLPGNWVNTIDDGDMFEYTNNAMAA